MSESLGGIATKEADDFLVAPHGDDRFKEVRLRQCVRAYSESGISWGNGRIAQSAHRRFSQWLIPCVRVSSAL